MLTVRTCIIMYFYINYVYLLIHAQQVSIKSLHLVSVQQNGCSMLFLSNFYASSSIVLFPAVLNHTGMGAWCRILDRSALNAPPWAVGPDLAIILISYSYIHVRTVRVKKKFPSTQRTTVRPPLRYGHSTVLLRSFYGVSTLKAAAQLRRTNYYNDAIKLISNS